MISKILIANRGEIALRIARTCREMGIRTVVAHSSADRESAAVAYADEAVQIGPAPSRHSYLNQAAVVEAALQAGAGAVHPGYGFLSEDPDFAEICEAHGLTFIGPDAAVIGRLGDKARARAIAAEGGLPVLPGTQEAVRGADEARRIAAEIGYPVIVKAVAGGGGRGITVVRREADLAAAHAGAEANAQAIFGDPRLYIEKFLERARHVEAQILADRYGNVVHLGVRDCSVQRRRQKLIEETPPPGIAPETVEEIGMAAARAAGHAGYTGAGTYEFLLDENGAFHFMETNCRIQVEHPVSEMVTGVDLVREQIRVADGERLALRQPEVVPRGVSVECRVNAEDPARGFVPAPGRIEEFEIPAGPFTRVDTHCRPGDRVTGDYDSLIAKVVVWAPDRVQAVARMDRALAEFVIAGPGMATTIPFLRRVLADPRFRAGTHTTSLVDEMLATESCPSTAGAARSAQ
ncbi:acetyl/propionyl/methylcrotonyl-CoA carboxylase subunit alpha [Actinomadura sp. 9N407]|uniref:acetyl/propionyl/methylcrotonyl-CoA carboxylase subunit alpha n=1 Tax=Actinomadura sp. 9N407 TaxID=3375154 RepID=UPI0037A4DAF5